MFGPFSKPLALIFRSVSFQKTCARWSTSMNACPSASANCTASQWEDPSTVGFTTPAANASDLNAWTMAARP